MNHPRIVYNERKAIKIQREKKFQRKEVKRKEKKKWNVDVNAVMCWFMLSVEIQTKQAQKESFLVKERKKKLFWIVLKLSHPERLSHCTTIF